MAGDESSLAQMEKIPNLCKGMPKGVIKYINMQTALCPICKKCDRKNQNNIKHLNETHNRDFRTTLEIIEDIKRLTASLKEKAKKERKEKPRRIALMEAAEEVIKDDVEQLKLLLEA